MGKMNDAALTQLLISQKNINWWREQGDDLNAIANDPTVGPIMKYKCRQAAKRCYDHANWLRALNTDQIDQLQNGMRLMQRTRG